MSSIDEVGWGAAMFYFARDRTLSPTPKSSAEKGQWKDKSRVGSGRFSQHVLRSSILPEPRFALSRRDSQTLDRQTKNALFVQRTSILGSEGFARTFHDAPNLDRRGLSRPVSVGLKLNTFFVVNALLSRTFAPISNALALSHSHAHTHFVVKSFHWFI